MTSTLRRRLLLTFAGLAVVAVIASAAAVTASVRLYGAQQRVVDELFAAYSSSTDLNQALVDQEAGFQELAMTGDESSRVRYERGLQSAAQATDRLARVELDLPTLRARGEEVGERVAQWRSEVVDPALARLDRGGIVDAATLSESQRRFEQVLTASQAYRDEVERLRQDSVDELRRDLAILFTVLALGLVLLVCLAAGVWVALRRWVTRPLEALGVEVERVQGGDLSRRVAIEEAPDEIRVLAQQIERMRGRIAREVMQAERSRAEALRARATVEEQAEDLLRSNAELEQFAYVASHDLQEPLRKVASFCQLIERRYKGQLDERGEQYIEFAVDGAKRMQQLINDLLAFSRVGRHTSAFADVELEQVTAQALRQLAAAIEESGAVVTHDPLPTVHGESGLLVQLLQNLVGNAIKFRSASLPRVHIGVRRSPGDDAMWEFSCRDNGIGIDPGYEDKIFVIFQRLHGRDEYGGTGIGLAMCKKIVEYHGGRLWLATTAEGAGSMFCWTLPVSGEQVANGSNDTRTHGRTSDDGSAGAADRDLARGGRPG